MIDFTKPVMTTDGQPVEIISTDGRGKYPLIGYVGVGPQPFTWTKDGRFYDDEQDSWDLVNATDSNLPRFAFFALSTYSSEISPRQCANAIAAKSESAIGKALKIKFENDLPVSVEIV